MRWSEIKRGEVFMQLLSSFVASMSGFFGAGKATEMDIFIISRYYSPPFMESLNPTNTNVSAGIVWATLFVLIVLSARCSAQVMAAIIQAVVVNMIYVNSMAQTKNGTMHANRMIFIYSAYCVPLSIYVLCAPIPLHKPVIISGINERILSACKWNNFVRLVRWLGNCVSFHAVSHLSSLQGRLLPSHFTLARLACA